MKFIIVSLLFLSFFGRIHVYSQTIPFGTSFDSILIDIPLSINGTLYYDDPYIIYYYKPVNYDSVNSPILLYIHGSGGTGAEGPAVLSNIADRRNALIVAPSMGHGGMSSWAYLTEFIKNNAGCFENIWSTEVFKQIYRHILLKENRNSIPLYLTGFSQGAQFVSRYMLVRQFDPDTIPIQMAVSVSAANYTLCTDNFMNSEMRWDNYRCGLAGWHLFKWGGICAIDTPLVNTFICKQHILQYYNENYGVLVGTLDTATFTGFCPNQGGKDRYERAIAFYNFSDTNAVSRGTSLKWKIDSIPGVAHNVYALYNTPAAGDSIPIAERMLFETPWHTVPSFAPVAGFNYTDSALTVSFSDASQNTNNRLWVFGDGDSSLLQNPVHTYTASGTYNVCLTAGDACASDTYCDSVTVTGVGINEAQRTYSKFTIQPNPVNNAAVFNFSVPIQSDVLIGIYNCIGQNVAILFNNYAESEKQYSLPFDFHLLPEGIYFGILKSDFETTILKIAVVK